jgi:hypothetical protein
LVAALLGTVSAVIVGVDLANPVLFNVSLTIALATDIFAGVATTGCHISGIAFLR